MWKKQLDHRIKPLPDGCDRISCVQLRHDNGIAIIISVYMPCRGSGKSEHEFSEVCDRLGAILEKYHECDIILAGDFNTVVSPNPVSDRQKLLSKTLSDYNVSLPDSFPDSPTFIHPNGCDSTRIDFCFSSESASIHNIKILDALSVNSSDHYPVSAQVKLSFSTNAVDSVPKQKMNRVLWHKVDVDKYQGMLQSKILQGSLALKSNFELEEEIKQTLNIINQSAQEAMPPLPKLKPGTERLWNPDIAKCVKQSATAFHEWKAAGRPADPTHPATINRKEAKKDLRKQQRYEAARRRDDFYQALGDAHYSDRKTYHRLIRKQNSLGSSILTELKLKDRICTTPEEICEGWAQHFAGLATPSEDEDYDSSYQQMASFDIFLLERFTSTQATQIPPFTTTEVQKAISSLNLGKSPDVHGLTAEHLKNGGLLLTFHITNIFNSILQQKKVPACLKEGIVTPIWKRKTEKNLPTSYRGITVTPVLCKLLEVLLGIKLDKILLPTQSRLQRGFTRGTSPLQCGFLLQEMAAESKISRKPYYEALLDAKSAFDVVFQDSLYRRLFHDGVQGDLWTLTRNLSLDAASRVKWQSLESTTFPILQGVRQGGSISTNLYKRFLNPMLEMLNESRLGATIGSISIPAPCVADDVTLASNSPSNLQAMLDISCEFSKQQRYDIQASKSKIIVYNGEARKDMTQMPYRWEIRDSEIAVKPQGEHLGTIRNGDFSATPTVEENIKKARRSLYRMLGAGLHGKGGLPPAVIRSILQAYYIPVLTYGLEIFILTKSQIELLEKEFKSILLQLLSLPRTTATVAPYILMGFRPVEAMLHIKILTFLRAISTAENSLEKEVLERQIVMKKLDEKTWTSQARRLLAVYNLPSIFELLESQPTKTRWKAIVTRAVDCHWKEYIQQQANTYSSLLFQTQEWSFETAHPLISSISNSPQDVYRSTTKIRLVTSSFRLQASRLQFNQTTPDKTCLLCKRDDETLQHFLMECDATSAIRSKYLAELREISNRCDDAKLQMTLKSYLSTTASIENLTTLILDCSSLVKEDRIHREIEHVTRRLCFALSHSREKRIEAIEKLPAR